MKLAVVIPTYKAHFPLLESLLINISEQTRSPDMVIIRASSCDDATPLNALLTMPWKFPINILYTPAKQHAGQNRNEGADAVPEDFDAISFIDSDDLMHPRRLELVLPFLEQGADAVFHDTIRGPRDAVTWGEEEADPVWGSISLQKETMFSVLDNCMVPFLRPIPMDEELEKELCIQFAHGTVRTSCFKAIRFNEGAFRYEDAQFVSDIVFNKYKTVTLRNRLSHYTTVCEEEEAAKYDVLK